MMMMMNLKKKKKKKVICYHSKMNDYIVNWNIS